MGTDLRYALRTLGKYPGLAAVAILSLALGIGANTAIFTVVDAVLLRLLPVQAPEQLYIVGHDPAPPNPVWNYPDYVAFQERNWSFLGIAAYSSTQPYGFSIQGQGADRPAPPAYGIFVSGNYFEVLGVTPALGRLLNRADDRTMGTGPHLALSHAFWKQRFGGDPRVIGQTIRVNRYPLTIVGVVRAGFSGADIAASPDFFVPITMRSELTSNRSWNNRNNWWINLIGRLKPGVESAQAAADLYTIAKAQEEDNRRTAVNQRYVNTAPQVHLMPGSQGYSFTRNRLTTPLRILTVVVGLVLLIACANVANLLLARASARRREIAVRLAVGAGRGRLIRQFLTESLLLAGLGGAAGVGLSYAAVPRLVDLIPSSGWTPVRLAASPDWRVLGFTLLVSLAAGVLFGLAPALQSSRADLVEALKEEGAAAAAGGSRFSLRKGLVVLQVALSLLLTIGAGLFVRSLTNLRELDSGFRHERLLIVDVDPLRAGYTRPQTRSFYERLRERVEALPGVRTATLGYITPLSGSRSNDSVSVEGYRWKQGEKRYIDVNAVGPRFFEALGIPVVLGRDFTPQDSPAETPEADNRVERPPGTEPPLTGPRVAIINESMAQRFFAGENPIGRRLSVDENFRMDRSYEIVGVVKDARYFGLRRDPEPMVYRALWRTGFGSHSLCILAAGDPQTLIEGVRREVHALDPAIPVLSARTMEQQVDNNVLQEKVVATLAGFFGMLALALASFGLYGLMTHAVARRTREIGIRMALGAETRAVLWLVLRDATLLVLIGAAIGIPAALGAARYAASILYGVTPADPLSFAAATAALLGVAAAASFVPAFRAARIDPIRALRHE